MDTEETCGRVRGFDLHPEILQESRSQYRITDEHLGEGTAKEKFRANLMAIQLLKKCEEENALLRQRNRRSLPDMLAGAAYLTVLTRRNLPGQRNIWN